MADDDYNVQANLEWDPDLNVGNVTIWQAQTINHRNEVTQRIRVEVNCINGNDRDQIKLRISKDFKGFILEEPSLPAHRRNKKSVELLNTMAAKVSNNKACANMLHAQLQSANEAKKKARKIKFWLPDNIIVNNKSFNGISPSDDYELIRWTLLYEEKLEKQIGLQKKQLLIAFYWDVAITQKAVKSIGADNDEADDTDVMDKAMQAMLSALNEAEAENNEGMDSGDFD